MSFGFSVGDFLAVAKLARQLYRDIYVVARGAPQELQLLMTEIGALSSSVDFLIDEVENPQSVLVCAGESRCKAVNELMKRVAATLKEMEELAKKHRLVNQSAGRSKLKRGWDKLKWASDATMVDSLRAKLSYHNGMLGLLLTLAQKYTSFTSLPRYERRHSV